MASKSRPRTARKAQTPKSKSAASDEDDRTFQLLRRQKAQISDEYLEVAERYFAPGAGGSQYRRAALLTLTKSGAELITWAKGGVESGEAIADCCAGIEAVAARMRELSGMLDGAATRLMVALCVRNDAVWLLRAARAHHASDAPTSEAANG